MLPIILSSLLVTLVFVVPVGSGEKLSYILTVLLTIAVFLTIIGDTLPAISLTTSVLGNILIHARIQRGGGGQGIQTPPVKFTKI